MNTVEISPNKVVESVWFRSLVPIAPKDLPSVTTRIGEVARARPDDVALRRGADRMTYAELQDSALRLGAAIQRSGIRAGDVVALWGNASFEFVAAMLGAWHAGAVAFALDPTHPRERQRQLLEASDARALLLLPQEPGREQVPPTEGLAVVDARRLHEWPLEPSTAPRRGCDRAYIFCSSGSTGVPKLIVGNHRGLSHFLAWQRTEFAIGRDDSCLWTTNTTFDVVLRDIFLVLCAGGVLRLPAIGETHLLDTAKRHGITCLHSTPTRLGAWLSPSLGGGPYPALRLVFSAGEPLPAALAARVHAACPNARLVNLYGPTETTLAKFAHVVTDVVDGMPIPVGRPLPDVRLHILDEHLRPCPTGSTGEIAIQTPYRSSGYLGAPVLMAQRFFDLPGADDGVYLSGDLGHVDERGRLVVAGRKDDQFKLRGVLVNPGEIEAHIQAIPGILRAKVVAAGSDAMSQRLLAFYVPTSADAPLPDAIRQQLASTLPPTLVPSRCVAVAQMPMTANGKVDKARLLAEIEDMQHAACDAAMPEIEGALVQFLMDIRTIEHLCAPHTPLHIDSLASVALNAFIESRWDVSIPAARLAAADCLWAIAKLVRSEGREGGDNKLYCFPPISGWGLVYRRLTEALSPARQVVAFDFVTGDAVAKDFAQRIAREHPDGPVDLLGYSAGGILAFEVARHLEAQGVDVRHLLLLDTAPRTAAVATGPALAGEAQRFGEEFTSFLAGIGFLEEIAQVGGGHGDELRRIVRDRIAAYRTWLADIHHAGGVHADIAVIRAASESEVDDHALRGWRALTRGRVDSIQGHGNHLSMLEPDFVSLNAGLVELALKGDRHRG